MLFLFFSRSGLPLPEDEAAAAQQGQEPLQDPGDRAQDGPQHRLGLEEYRPPVRPKTCLNALKCYVHQNKFSRESFYLLLVCV